LKIVNIVAIASVREDFDLSLLDERIPETQFPSSNKAAWIKMRLTPENYYVAFYKSGKFLVTGVSDFELVDKIVERVLCRLEKAGIKAHLEAITIHNIVLTDTVELSISLEHLVESLGDAKAYYEPEQFPALFYKDSAGMSYTLFSSGKMVVTGVTDLATAQRNVKRFKNLVAA
jgi:transcription initiation factor TFIID TATA-box-binding protein